MKDYFHTLSDSFKIFNLEGIAIKDTGAERTAFCKAIEAAENIRQKHGINPKQFYRVVRAAYFADEPITDENLKNLKTIASDYYAATNNLRQVLTKRLEAVSFSCADPFEAPELHANKPADSITGFDMINSIMTRIKARAMEDAQRSSSLQRER